MNEQLVVKNFGPIKDATVDFKRVTVFIGPTGGGKSTLAKLAAIVKQKRLLNFNDSSASDFMSEYGLSNYLHGDNTHIKWQDNDGIGFNIGGALSNADDKSLEINQIIIDDYDKNYNDYKDEIIKIFDELIDTPERSAAHKSVANKLKKDVDSIIKRYVEEKYQSVMFSSIPHYIPSERLFLAAIGESWTGIIRDDIGLPKVLVNFANQYSNARKNIHTLHIPFLNTNYNHSEGSDFVQLDNKELLPLSETASGIQSVTPLLVLLEHLSRNTEQAQSFIIEEPELNLYPTAQQGLLNWLVEKCTKGENDLTITTHSPYILSHLNLLLYAYQVAEKHPDRAEEVAKLVPRESWINPAEFACYQVEGGGVTSLVNTDLGLIDDNGLDNLSGDAADAFDNLIRLSKAVALK